MRPTVILHQQYLRYLSDVRARMGTGVDQSLRCPHRVFLGFLVLSGKPGRPQRARGQQRIELVSAAFQRSRLTFR